MFKVDLVDDAGTRRHDLEIVQCLLPPAQEGIALLVALEFDVDVFLDGVAGGEDIHLHGMVDHQFDRCQRIDQAGIAAEGDHGVAHRGQVDDTGDAGEVLQDHARRHEGDLGIRFGLGIPVGDRADALVGDIDAVFVAQQVLQQDLHRIRQLAQIEALAKLGQARIAVGLAVDLEGIVGRKAVFHGDSPCCRSGKGGAGRQAGIVPPCPGAGFDDGSQMGADEPDCNRLPFPCATLLALRLMPGNG